MNWTRSKTYLIHRQYASPYYDPVKAHEYYMRTRELKGRTSTAGLNEEGREAAQYVKKKITEERKAADSKSKAAMENRIQARKDTKTSRISIWREGLDRLLKSIKDYRVSSLEEVTSWQKNNLSVLSEAKKEKTKTHSEQTKSEIEKLREKLKGMSKEEKARHKDEIQREIDKLRETNKKFKESLGISYKWDAAKVRGRAKSDKEKIRNEAKSNTNLERGRFKEVTTAERTSYTNDVKSYRDTHKKNREKNKEEATNKYIKELDRIKSDSRFVKTKK